VLGSAGGGSHGLAGFRGYRVGYRADMVNALSHADPSPNSTRKPQSAAPAVVVITGASAGIGRAVARRYGEQGASVALIARGEGGLEAAAEDVRRRGGTALALSVDVADAVAVEQAADRIEKELGPIDVWINVAFSSVFAPFLDVTPEEYERATEVTYFGFVNGTRAALRRMKPRDRGVVVQVGSALAYRGIPLQTAYCGAKHAVQGFTESLRCELLHDRSGVRVTMVQMPAVNTPQFDWVISRLPRHPQPVPPIYQPELAADAVVFAARHPKRREYWVGGSTAMTLLADKFVPGLLDRYLARTGYKSQQTDQAQGSRRGNLWEPMDDGSGEDRGAHGSFDGRATTRSPQVWLSQHHGTVSAVLGGAASAVLGWRVLHRLGR
jgi:NAD(P)-dependent dehydrogenase (short-subunit alcohol dehydrogenase family)